MSLPCWPVDWFLHAHFRGCFWRQLPNSRPRQAVAKQSDFHAFCVLSPSWELSIFFFLEGLCCDQKSLLWTLVIWIPGSGLFKPQLLQDSQFNLLGVYPFPVPSPFPSLSSLFYLAKRTHTEDRASEVRRQGKRGLTAYWFYNLKVHFMMTSCHQQDLFHEMLVLEVDTDVKV